MSFFLSFQFSSEDKKSEYSTQTPNALETTTKSEYHRTTKNAQERSVTKDLLNRVVQSSGGSRSDERKSGRGFVLRVLRLNSKRTEKNGPFASKSVRESKQ